MMMIERSIFAITSGSVGLTFESCKYGGNER